MTAINRGVRFEICYSQCIDSDSNGRRNFISNVMNLVRATKGRGLIVSSEARNVLSVRGPADVGNLLGVWGLARERAAETIGVNCRAVIVNEGLKRTSFRGVVDVIDGGEPYVAPAKDQGNAKRKRDEGEGEDTPKLSKRAKARLRKEAKANELRESSAQSTTPNLLTAPATPGIPSTSKAQSNG